jgi:hypothetical protein
MGKRELLKGIDASNENSITGYAADEVANPYNASIPPVPSGVTVIANQNGDVTINVDFTVDKAHTHPNSPRFIVYGYRTDAPDNILVLGEFSDSTFPWHPKESYETWMIALSCITASEIESAKCAWIPMTISTFSDDFSVYGGSTISALEKLNWLKIGTMESNETWADGSFSFSNNFVIEGLTSILGDAHDLGASHYYMTLKFTKSIDLSSEGRFTDNDYVLLVFHSDRTLTNGLSFIFASTGFEMDNSFQTIYVLPINAGYNFIKILKSEFSITGTPSWATIERIYITSQVETSDFIPYFDDLRIVKADPDDATTFNDTGRAWDFPAGVWHIYDGNRPGEPSKKFSLGQIESGGADICLAMPPLAQVTNGKMSAGVYIKGANSRAGLAFRIADPTANSEDFMAAILDTAADKVYLTQWEAGGLAAATVNYVNDPSFEVATLTTYWTNSGLATFAKSTTYKYLGSNSLHCVSDAAGDYCYGGTIADADGGETWTASAYIYLLSGDCRLTIQEKTGGGAWSDKAYVDLAIVNEGFERIEIMTTLTAGVTDARIKIGPAATAASEFYVDCVQFEQTAAATEYADGSLGVGYAWSGTANASSSTAEIYSPETLDSAIMTLAIDTLYYVGVDFKDSDGENRVKVYVTTQQEKLFTAETMVISKASNIPFPEGYGVGCLSWQCNSRFVDFRAGSPAHADFADKAGYAQSAGGLAPMTADYKTATAQTMTNNAFTIVDYDTVESDLNNLVTVGAAWAFTAKEAGKYDVNASILLQSTNTWALGEFGYLVIFKNGIEYRALDRKDNYSNTASYMMLHGSTEVPVSAGDTIDIRCKQNSGGNLNLYNNALYNYVTIGKKYNAV